MRKTIRNKRVKSPFDSFVNFLRSSESKRSDSHFVSLLNKTIPSPKRSQQEIAGFVLIVLIVSVIGVVFLSLSLGKNDINKETSVEVSNLLISAMHHTTDCAVNYIPQYRDVQDLIKECYKDKIGDYRKCLDGRDVCKELETNFKEILDKGLVIEDSNVNKAYNLDIYFSSDDENKQKEEILSIERGNFINCSSIVGGSHPIPIGSFISGKIETELLVCKE